MEFLREMLRKHGLGFTTLIIKLITAFITTVAITGLALAVEWYVHHILL